MNIIQEWEAILNKYEGQNTVKLTDEEELVLQTFIKYSVQLLEEQVKRVEKNLQEHAIHEC